MKTIRDLILERFVQKEITTISGAIADEIQPALNYLAHEIAREDDKEKLESLQQRYKKLNDVLIAVAITSTCADVSVDEIMSLGISVDRIVRHAVKL